MSQKAIVPAIVALTLLMVGCANDGRELRPPTPAQVAAATTSTTSNSTTTSEVAPEGFYAQTPWGQGGTIDSRYTCDGDGISPSLTWGNIPQGTVSLALTAINTAMLTDDGESYLLWTAANIPTTATGLSEGAVPEGVVEGLNSAGGVGWVAPCPPAGELHRIDITVYAMGSNPGVTSGMSGQAMLEAFVANAIGEYTITGNYPAP